MIVVPQATSIAPWMWNPVTYADKSRMQVSAASIVPDSPEPMRGALHDVFCK